MKGNTLRNTTNAFLPNIRSNRNAALEAEIKEYDEQRTNPDDDSSGQQKGGDPASTATTGWEKRYADLRSFSQKKENELNKKIESLQNQISNMAEKEFKFPKSPEEVASWIERFPEVGAMVRTIALQEVQEVREEVKKTRETIAQEKRIAEKEKELLKLLKAHPDFLDIRETEEFHEWAEGQARWVQIALYDEDQIDSQPAIDAVRLYKADTQKAPSKKETLIDDRRDAARGVKSSKTAPDVVKDSNKVYESDIEKMSQKEYELHSDAIDTAMREGRFVYDLSGAAR